MPHCCCKLKFSFGNSEYPFLSECVSLWVRVDTDVAWRIWQLFRWIRLKLSQVEERKTSRQLSWKVNSICSTSSLTVSHHFSTECTMLLCERANRRVREYVCVCGCVFMRASEHLSSFRSKIIIFSNYVRLLLADCNHENLNHFSALLSSSSHSTLAATISNGESWVFYDSHSGISFPWNFTLKGCTNKWAMPKEEKEEQP